MEERKSGVELYMADRRVGERPKGKGREVERERAIEREARLK